MKRLENCKYSILVNELNRRFEVMSDDITIEEKTEVIDKFTQQLVNSGYRWNQIREIILSSLKSITKKERKQKENSETRYKTGDESLESRMRKKLLEATEWYKKDGERNNSEELDMNIEIEKFKNSINHPRLS